MNVPKEAALRVRMMLERIRASGERVALITLTDYADKETFDFWLASPGWTFAQWQTVNLECKRQLEAQGFKVRLVRLDAREYLDWLVAEGLENSPANRAAFAALRT